MSTLDKIALCVAWFMIGALFAGLWWQREFRSVAQAEHDWREALKASYEREIRQYQGHIDRMRMAVGLEPIFDDHDDHGKWMN